jgi:hypothetical protein
VPPIYRDTQVAGVLDDDVRVNGKAKKKHKIESGFISIRDDHIWLLYFMLMGNLLLGIV